MQTAEVNNASENFTAEAKEPWATQQFSLPFSRLVCG